ncbi:MAG: chemotaxis protein CheW [Deltaproteobacteria bacterium]|nr:chemotaxis protein CheW [Deltaproteobacteria bacterium]MBW2075094.1 chemotaxis protein CheW [Deltaproteobacteria bacterium]RLB81521.1 MAG: hybrid sensor histidine kinase/response regulator [Deltaproteobacteria bacterium]
MGIEDDEILQSYVEESLEHLADIENNLLAIEQRGADIDVNLVNKVFRAAHSIKGGAGFMGLDNIKELAHKIENVLGLIRSREMMPSPDTINVVLLAFDKLQELISNAERSNEMDISEHTLALTNLTTASLSKEEKESVSRMVNIRLPDGRVVFTIPEFDISQATKEGKFLYLVEYDLIHDVQNKGKTPLEVLTVMQKSGIILECKVDISSVGSLEDDAPFVRLPFIVLFSTIIDPGIITALFEVEEKYIHLVTEDMMVKISAAGPPEAGPEVEKISVQPGTLETGKKPEPKSEVQEEGVQNVVRAPAVTQAETSLRVHVSLLDLLMTLAGELVLGRNQLLQTIGSGDQHALELVGQRIDLVTSELQEAIMLTRMQPIGNIFNKFPRVVRDLAGSLGKEVNLTLQGKEVELDKTIIEGLGDPLTHLVRNSVDHGIEVPDVRRKQGKDPAGQIVLRAYHEAGQVNIEITDDGKGLDGDKLAATAVQKGLITEEQARTMSDKEKVNLIFLPGFSTAEKVTDVSGRGVGMDVVKTNLDKLGGVVNIDSEPGKGTTIRIKLPLTLAIIPSQIISNGGERYAIPQVNLDELLRIPASQVKERIEKVGDAEVVRLRGRLLPIISLADVLGIERTYIDPTDGQQKPDRRKGIIDRRSKVSPLFEDDSVEHDQPGCNSESETHNLSERRTKTDRRYHASSAVNIVVVSAGAFKYGLVVDEFRDSEEIVVKPLGRHLKHCKGYAGATIMGDGRVALILDVSGLAQMAGLTSMEGTDRALEVAQEASEAIRARRDVQALLVFRNAEDEQFAVPLALVARIEKINKADIELVGGKKVIQYRGGSLPLYTIEEVAEVKPLADNKDLIAIVFTLAGREVGLLATGPVDAIEVAIDIDDSTLKQTGIMGSAIIGGYTTLMVDIFGLVEALTPQWFEDRKAVEVADGKAATILLAEDSGFFRNQVKEFMEAEGYNVIEAEDGMVAWNLLQEHAEQIALVVTDIEMPNLDGFALTKRIREDPRFSDRPVIALTSLAGDEDVARGKQVGIDDYQIKMDKERLLGSIYNYLNKGR